LEIQARYKQSLYGYMALHNWLISLPQTEPIVALNFVFEQTQKVFIYFEIFFACKVLLKLWGQPGQCILN